MTAPMSQSSIPEYLKVQRARYLRRTGKSARTVLLNEVCEVTGMDRKHLIKVLKAALPIRGEAAGAGRDGRGRPGSYSGILPVIKGLWLASEQPCGKRLHSILSTWRPYWEAEHGALNERERRLLKAISPAQIDRLLKPHRAEHSARRQRCGAAGAAIKAQVPLRTGPWQVSGPGWTELDSVAHCGGSMAGCFWWTLVQTDIWSGWTEQQPVWNKGQETTRHAAADMEKALPFALLGVDTDNGSEFLNWHLLAWWQAHTPPITVTRSRPYRKNDNAHVEQKNRTHVRGLLGEDRLDERTLQPALEELHRIWSQLHNYFLPTLKLTGKERTGGRVRKTYEPVARTPCQRLLDDGKLSPRAAVKLRAQRSGHNPFRLRERAEELLKEIWARQGAAEQEE
jgi:hypothetical protein